jgi:hypothetical protein
MSKVRDAYASRAHLPKSKVSLDHYESLVSDELRGFTSMSDLDEAQRLLVLGGWRAGKKPAAVASVIEGDRAVKTGLASWDTSRWLHKPKVFKMPFSAERVVASLKRQYGDVAEVTGPHTFRTDLSESGVSEVLAHHYARAAERSNPQRAREVEQRIGFELPSMGEMGVSILPDLPPGTRRG